MEISAHFFAPGLTEFIFDDQTHFLRDDFPHEAILGLGEFAAEHWNPKLKEEGLSLTRYKFENYYFT